MCPCHSKEVQICHKQNCWENAPIWAWTMVSKNHVTAWWMKNSGWKLTHTLWSLKFHSWSIIEICDQPLNTATRMRKKHSFVTDCEKACTLKTLAHHCWHFLSLSEWCNWAKMWHVQTRTLVCQWSSSNCDFLQLNVFCLDGPKFGTHLSKELNMTIKVIQMFWKCWHDGHSAAWQFCQFFQQNFDTWPQSMGDGTLCHHNVHTSKFLIENVFAKLQCPEI